MKNAEKFVGIAVFLFMLTSIPHGIIQSLINDNITFAKFWLEHLRIWIPICAVAIVAYIAQRK